MAQTVIRANISPASLPLLSEFSGRGIILRQQDQNYSPQLVARSDTDKDVGIPTLYYAHNVMPAADGFQSVGYADTMSPAPGVTGEFERIITVRSGLLDGYLGITTSGQLFASTMPYYAWTFVASNASWTGRQVTTAHADGVSYIGVEGIGVFSYIFGSNTITQIGLGGVAATSIKGVVESGGYLLVYSADSVLWSSVISVTDFVPSLATGAGGGVLQEAVGSIITCVPITGGFVVYCAHNIVTAKATGNKNYPFSFKAIAGSGGLYSRELVAPAPLGAAQYAYTTNGLQKVALDACNVEYPEIIDFLAGSVFEDFDETLQKLVITAVPSVMKKKLAVVSARYLVLSYGINSLTHAIVIDTALKRLGKLKVPHVACFEFNLRAAESVETPRDSIAFLQADGAVKTVNFDNNLVSSNGVAIVGKFQIIRQRLCTLQSVDLDNVRQGYNFSCSNLWTLDGKTPQRSEGYLSCEGELSRTYLFSDAGINHSLLLQGAFSLVSVIVALNNSGRR